MNVSPALRRQHLSVKHPVPKSLIDDVLIAAGTASFYALRGGLRPGGFVADRAEPRGGIIRSRRRFRVVAAAFAVIFVALGLGACQPVKQPGPSSSLVSTNPPLFPGFQSDVFDYVNRCNPNTATDVHVNAPGGTTVSVNGLPPASGQFTVQVSQNVGKRFTFVVTTNGNSTTHHVRCLPGDFPDWSVEKSGTPQAAFYATTLLEGFAAPSYPVIFDANGVPVWWLNRKPTSLFNPLPNNHFATVVSGAMEEYDLNGNVVRAFNTVGAGADFHDVLLLPNGNYVMATEQEQPCNLTSWGLGPLESCANHVIQELQPPATPGGPPVVVWSWDTSLHIPVTRRRRPGGGLVPSAGPTARGTSTRSRTPVMGSSSASATSTPSTRSTRPSGPSSGSSGAPPGPRASSS